VKRDSRAVRETQRPDILYIMGFGRSGTTILEVILSVNPGIFGAGELTHILRDGFRDAAVCACGEPACTCPVWSRVGNRVGRKPETLAAGIETLRRFEAHERFPLVAAGLFDSTAARQYRRINDQLFESLGEISGAQVVVDSSKYAGRALMLARCFPHRVRVICLTRSPGGLMHSFRKPHRQEQRQKSVVGTLAYYMYVFACLRVASLRLPNVLHVAYEELTADPVGTLERIEQWSGYDLSRAREKLRAGEFFQVGHIVTGNRLRKQGRVRFCPTAGSGRVHGLVARLAVGVMTMYGKLLGY
jgi:hypothetical protein